MPSGRPGTRPPRASRASPRARGSRHAHVAAQRAERERPATARVAHGERSSRAARPARDRGRASPPAAARRSACTASSGALPVRGITSRLRTTRSPAARRRCVHARRLRAAGAGDEPAVRREQARRRRAVVLDAAAMLDAARRALHARRLAAGAGRQVRRRAGDEVEDRAFRHDGRDRADRRSRTSQRAAAPLPATERRARSTAHLLRLDAERARAAESATRPAAAPSRCRSRCRRSAAAAAPRRVSAANHAVTRSSSDQRWPSRRCRMRQSPASQHRSSPARGASAGSSQPDGDGPGARPAARPARRAHDAAGRRQLNAHRPLGAAVPLLDARRRTGTSPPHISAISSRYASARSACPAARAAARRSRSSARAAAG